MDLATKLIRNGIKYFIKCNCEFCFLIYLLFFINMLHIKFGFSSFQSTILVIEIIL